MPLLVTVYVALTGSTQDNDAEQPVDLQNPLFCWRDRAKSIRAGPMSWEANPCPDCDQDYSFPSCQECMAFLGWEPDTWKWFGTVELEHVPMPPCPLCGELHAMRLTDPEGFKEGQINQTCPYSI